MSNTDQATPPLTTPTSVNKTRNNCKVSGCPKQIQSNYDGHCSGCFRKKWPIRFSEISAAKKIKRGSNDEGIKHKTKRRNTNTASMNCTNWQTVSQLSNNQKIIILLMT